MKNYVDVKMNDDKTEKLFKEHQIKCPYCGNPPDKIHPIKFDQRSHTVTFVCQCWSGHVGEKEPQHYFLVKISHIKEIEFDNDLLPYD